MSEANIRRKLSVGSIVCIVLSILLLPLLIVNVTLVIKGMTNEKEPPSIFGYMPLAVVSGSMDDGSKNCIKIGDMIFVKEVDIEDLKIDDIITFNIGEDYITHRILNIVYTDETKTEVDYFITKGDANNTTDGQIYAEQIHGRYVSRVAGLGKFALFLQTPWGILLFVGLPVAVYCIFEVTGRMNAKRKQGEKDASIAEKEAEIERLRALLEGQASASEEEETPVNVDSVNTEGDLADEESPFGEETRKENE